MAVDEYSQSNLLYYTTKAGLYALDEVTRQKTKLVAGYTKVTLQGFNFGAAASDVIALTVNGKLCDNVIHYSSNKITCVLSQPGEINKHADVNAGSTPVAAARTQHANSSDIDNDKWFSHRDVDLRTTSGRAVSLSLSLEASSLCR